MIFVKAASVRFPFSVNDAAFWISVLALLNTIKTDES